jgi:hypothetical protein
LLLVFGHATGNVNDRASTPGCAALTGRKHELLIVVVCTGDGCACALECGNNVTLGDHVVVIQVVEPPSFALHNKQKSRLAVKVVATAALCVDLIATRKERRADEAEAGNDV